MEYAPKEVQDLRLPSFTRAVFSHGMGTEAFRRPFLDSHLPTVWLEDQRAIDVPNASTYYVPGMTLSRAPKATSVVSYLESWEVL
jgi:hypothetical protein